MKELILDCATWRCGQTGPNQLGRGHTALENEEGFMCCLGQFGAQINPEVKDRLLNNGEPNEIPALIEGLNFYDDEGDMYRDTELSNDAMRINDNENTTPDRKIALLKKLFAKHDFEIEVINHPPQAQDNNIQS